MFAAPNDTDKKRPNAKAIIPMMITAAVPKGFVTISIVSSLAGSCLFDCEPKTCLFLSVHVYSVLVIMIINLEV